VSKQRSTAAALAVPALLLWAMACSRGESATQDAKQLAATQGSRPAPAAPTVAVASTRCDASLWNHVYNPKRLQQLSPCITVTGVIDESDADPDGDQHFLLKLDPGQESLLVKRNTKKKGGDLVLEIVCANPPMLKKVKSACVGYTNAVPIPAVGSHVRVTGTYVLDSHNGWTEIHPVSLMERL
jgi:hypothetical protein